MSAAAVVVGVDGSPSSIDALRWAADYARLAGSPLLAVSAWHWPVAMVISVPVPEGFDPTAEAQQTLDSVLADELGKDPGFPVTTRVAEGAAAQALIAASHGPGCWSSAAADTADSPGCCSDQSASSARTTRHARWSSCVIMARTRPNKPAQDQVGGLPPAT